MNKKDVLRNALVEAQYELDYKKPFRYSPEIVGVYLAGSRLMNTNLEDSDWDIIVVYAPTPKQIYDGKRKGYKSSFHNSDGTKVEVKFVDVRDYLQGLKLSKIEPLRMACASEKNKVFPETKKLSIYGQNVKYFIQYFLSSGRYFILANPKTFFYSVKGQTKALIKDANKMREASKYGESVKDSTRALELVRVLKLVGMTGDINDVMYGYYSPDYVEARENANNILAEVFASQVEKELRSVEESDLESKFEELHVKNYNRGLEIHKDLEEDLMDTMFCQPNRGLLF